MRVMTRHVGETLRIGNDIIITVLQVRGDQVRLRVSAPQSVGVYREEIVSELSQAANYALSSRDVTAPPSTPLHSAGAP